MELKKVKKK